MQLYVRRIIPSRRRKTVAEARPGNIKEFSRWMAKFKRNFNERKNVLLTPDIYHREPPPAPPSVAEDAKSEVVSVPESVHETRSVTVDEDDKLQDVLSPQYAPVDLLNLCCLEGTRTSILQEIIEWFDDDKAPNLLWLCGGPGTGKTSICWSLIAELERQQRSGSEFFFRKGQHDPYMLWRTTAYKLTKFHPALKSTVYAALIEEPDATDTILSTFHKLVEEPLKAAVGMFHDKSPVLLIEALEQCNHDESWPALLQTLPLWLQLPPQCKLIVTSRPADDISKVFEGKDVVIKRMELHTGNDVDYDTNSDIRTYINHRFSEIKAQNKTLPESWPEYDDVSKLVTHAAGFFLWAKVALDAIATAPDIERHLTTIASSGTTLKFENLDEFLNDILHTSFGNEPSPAFRTTIGTVALAKAPLTMQDLKHLYPERYSDVSVEDICSKLLPVVSTGDDHQHLSIRHRSIVDYITDPKRCMDSEQAFLVDRAKANRNFTVACLKVMQSGLKFNICSLQSSHLSNDQIPNHAEVVEKAIPSHLSYACKYWADHLRDVSEKRDNEIVNLVKNILHFRFLYWLEVLSLINEMDVAPRLLVTAADWLEASDKELAAFALDASRFALTFSDPIAYSAPHIYISALPHAPPESRVYKHYKDQFPGVFKPIHDQWSTNTWPAMRFAFSMSDYIHNLSIHPDGKRAVVAMNDSTAHVWSLSTGTSLLKLVGHTGTIRAAAYSPSGKRIATGSDDRSVRIWDADTGNLLHGPYEIHGDWVRSVSWSPDATRLATGSDDRFVKVITVETGQPVFEAVSVHTDWVRSVAFTPDGLYVISGSDDRTMRVWDAATGSLVGDPFTGHTGYIRTVVVSPDGQRVASGSDDYRIMIYDLASRTQVGPTLRGHNGSVRGLAFSKDSKLLASASEDYMVRIWNVETGKRHCDSLQGHTSYVSSVAFTPDGKQLISGGEDSRVRVWEMDSLPVWRPDLDATGYFQAVLPLSDGTSVFCSDGENIWKWRLDSGDIHTTSFQPSKDPIDTHEHINGIRSTAFSPDGSRAATGGSDRNIYIWDTTTGIAILGPLEGHTDDIYGLAFSADGKRLVSGSDDQKVWVWDTDTGKSICGPLEGQHTSNVRAVCFSPDGTRVVSASHDRTMVVWKVETGEQVFPTMSQHSDWVNAVAYSPDGKYIASSSDDNTTLIWDAGTGEVVYQPLRGHTHYLRAVAWSPDSKRIVSGGLDRIILVFDVETGATLFGPLHGHTDQVASVAFTTDGSRVLSASRDGTVRLWDLQPRSFSRSGSYWNHGDWVHCVTLSPDGGFVASGGDDNNVLVQDVTTGVERFPVLQGHEDWIRAVCYSSDGNILASCSDDGTIRLWNARTGESISDPEPYRGHAGSVRSIAFAPNSRLLVSGGEDATVRLWNTEKKGVAALEQNFARHTRDVNSVAFSPDGSRIVSGSASGDIIIISLVHLVLYLASQPFGGDGAVFCVAFSPDGTRIISAGESTALRVWDAATGQALRSITAHGGIVHSISMSPDGKKIISGGDDASIRIWDVETGDALSMPLRGHTDKVLCVAVSQDGRHLASGSADHAVMIWELNLEKRMTWPESFMRRVRDVEFCSVDEHGIFSDNSTVDDGWVRGAKSEALFWMPPTYRKGLWTPQTVGILGVPETAIDLRHFLHGTEWTKCQAEPSKV
ncbi:WD40 repeat-like protein [Artomyces pyxidatus]|uniref:WD40 repeat-like protein n=1 Tax=Artomyces pyxidatus TaxID=48021 RepID=A0ACB8SKQ5_9AGAM|nr:WD40 repeat-like protein [Artomyces pyxidatus]